VGRTVILFGTTPEINSVQDGLLHGVSFIMWSDGQKNYRIIRQILTKTIFTLRDAPAFFTYNKNYAEISINPDAATAFQV
jgi:hypothetical protein